MLKKIIFVDLLKSCHGLTTIPLKHETTFVT